jgi:glycogenin
MNFPSTHYEMSQDSAPFVPPERYPSPPRNMWYEVPKEPPAPPAHRPRQIFPWEVHQPTPSRTFAETPRERDFGVLATVSPGETPTTAGELIAPAEQSTIGNEITAAETTVEPATPTTPSVKVTPADPWTSFSLNNAWDEVPEISRYVDGLQKHRRIKSSGSAGAVSSPLGTPGIRGPGGLRFRGLKLTDFPSAAERPSLPVTPAPITRPSFWGDEGEHDDERDQEHLPAAEGVPAQAEWVCAHGRRWMPTDCLCELTNAMLPHKDPEAQLQKLARQQYEALLRKLGGQGDGEGSEEKGETREIPKRSLPFGSEDVRSPSHIVPSAPPPSRPTPGPGRKAPAAPILTKGAEATALSTLPTGRSETSEPSTGATLETTDTHSTLLESPLPRPKDERA